jgi:hypothetical protein
MQRIIKGLLENGRMTCLQKWKGEERPVPTPPAKRKPYRKRLNAHFVRLKSRKFITASGAYRAIFAIFANFPPTMTVQRFATCVKIVTCSILLKIVTSAASKLVNTVIMIVSTPLLV